MSTFALGSAVVEIKAEFRKFRDDLEKAKRETGAAADRMKTSLAAVGSAARGLAVVGAAAAAAGGGLLLLVQRAANAAEEIADMADKVGISTERLQELRFAFTQNGAAMGDVDRGLSRLNAGIGAFIQTGSGPAVQGLRAIGITSREAAARLGNTEQAFDEIVKRLAAIENPARRAGAASQLFGEEAGPKLAILIGQGSAKIDELSQKARDMGLVLRDDAVRQAAALSAQLRALGQVISTQMTNALIQLTPQVVELAQAFADSLPAILGWAEAIGRALGVLEAPVSAQIEERIAEMEEMQRGIERLEAIGMGGTGFARTRRERVAAIQEELTVLRERQRALQEAANAARTADPIVVPGISGAGGNSAEAMEAFTRALSEQRAEQRANIEILRTYTLSEQERAEAVRIMAARQVELRVAERLTAAAIAQNRAEGLASTAVTLEQEIAIGRAAEAAGALALQTARMEAAQQASAQATRQQASALESLEDNLISNIATAGSFNEALKRIAVTLLTSGLQGALFGRGAAGGLFNDLFGVASGGLAGLARDALGFGSFGPGPTINARGNAFLGGRVIPFASGGVIGSPTLFPMAGGNTGLMGEAGPEAIMPLKRGPGGKLGIEAGGGAIRVMLDPGLRAEIVGEAEGRTIQIVQQSQQGPGFAARVAAANRGASNARLR